MPKSDQPKITGLRKANGLKQSNETEDRQLKKWLKVFEDKFRQFKDTWTLTVSVECASETEWEYSLEERMSMACKCKDCGHVWVTDTGAACFYYSILKSVSDGNKGKALVWLKTDLCPNKENCGSPKMPLMDVYKEEVEAVISYLMMQIGWSLYGCQFTEHQETSVENRRLLRLKKLENAVKNKAIANKESVKSKIATQEKNIVSLGQSPTAKSGVQEKPRQLKSNMPQTTPTMDMGRNSKKNTRWDKTTVQMISEWELSFRSKFDRFTEKDPSHKWIMRLEKVTKKHPLRQENRWEHFLGEKVEAGFKCSQCRYVWESKRAWISFWIWQNPPNSEGKRIGEVAVHVLGQKCFKCPGNANMKDYVTGDLQPEEIDVVLDFLYMVIDYNYYNNVTYTHEDEVAIEERRPKAPFRYFGRAEHRKELCQPCQHKVCKKKVHNVYSGSAVASAEKVLAAT